MDVCIEPAAVQSAASAGMNALRSLEYRDVDTCFARKERSVPAKSVAEVDDASFG
jgi:hypothetical protein